MDGWSCGVHGKGSFSGIEDGSGMICWRTSAVLCRIEWDFDAGVGYLRIG